MSHKHGKTAASALENGGGQELSGHWTLRTRHDGAGDPSSNDADDGLAGLSSGAFGALLGVYPFGATSNGARVGSTSAGATDENASGLKTIALSAAPAPPASTLGLVNVVEGGAATIAGAGTAGANFTGSTGTLVIQDAEAFSGVITGLSGSDTIDLSDIAFNANTRATYVGSASGGTLTITDGTAVANIALTGDYLSSTWSVSSDGAGGTNVVDPSVSTNWQMMKVGAGGYGDGLDIAPDGTMVMRTDTNGAYLWNGTSWQQIVSSSSLPAAYVAANPGNSGQGVYEIQIAPSNSNIMYMAYNGYVFVSSNKGTSWTQTAFTQVSEQWNDSYRMLGQKMAVDPTNPNIVFVGTAQNGLWKTTNGGSTWSQVTAVPVSMAVSDDYPGITGILFDPGVGGAVGGATQTIFASSYGNGVYESTNGGSTWTHLSGGLSFVQYAAVSSTGVYYATDGSDVWDYANGAWTELLTGGGGNYQAITVNPQNANEVVVVMDNNEIDVSYNAGATWSGENAISPNGSQLTSTDIPWLQGANMSSAGGAWLTVGGIGFNPSNPTELYVTGGTGAWNVNIPTSGLTSSTKLQWTDMSVGVENLVANEILVAPGGNPILASWDRPFFDISNLNAYPSTYGPVDSYNIVAGWSIDYASSTPSFLVGLADWWGTEESGYSTDGGQTWTPFASFIPGADSAFEGGTIAASTTTNFIWAPSNNQDPYYTLDGGKTWTAITLPGVSSWSGFDPAPYLDVRSVTADRVLANTFYLYFNGVYESTNGGQSWTKVYSGNLTPEGNYNSEIMSVPGEAGNLFFTEGIVGDGTNPASLEGFYMSTNQGANWTAIANVEDVFCFGFGAAAPGSSYPTIYIVGYVNSVYGVWQSTNQGGSWTQIGTQPAGELDQIRTISGDPNVYGRVYVGFGGGGYAYLSGGPSVTSVTANPSSGAEAPGSTITFTVDMSESVTVSGGTPTLTLNNGGAATYVSGSGSSALVFTYLVSSGNSAVAELAISSASLNGATIQDSSGNAASLSGVATTFSNLSIGAESITGIAESPASGDLGVGKTVTFTLTLSQAVTISGGSPTLTLNDGGYATYSSGSGSNALTFSYTVTSSNTNVSSLAATAVNLNGATIANSGGNSVNLSLSSLTQTGPQIDATTPTITAIAESPSSGDLVAGETGTFTLSLNDVVNVSGGTPTLTLNDGGIATYSSGSGSNTLTFSYTVASSNSDVSSLSATAINLNGATIVNGVGTAATLSLSNLTQIGPQIGTTTTPTATTVTAISTSPSNGDLGVGKSVTFTLSLDGAATVVGTTTLTLNNGGVATYVSGSGSNTLTFSYTVSSSSTNVSSLSATEISETAEGQTATMSLTGLTQVGPQIDTTTPAITAVAESPSSADLGVGKTVTFTLSLSDAVTVSGGTPTLTLNDGGVATYASGSGSNALTFSYTVSSSNTNVSSLAATAVNLNGATIANGAGTATTLSLSNLTQTGAQIDTITPAITAISESPSSGSIGVGSTVAVTVKFSDAVTVSGGTPTLTLNDGGLATYVSGSGSNTLTFSYTVGLLNTNVSSLAATALNLGGATIANGAGTAANLSVSGVSQSGPAVAVSLLPPTLASIVESPASGNIGLGSTVTLTLNFSSAVNVSGGVPTLALNSGGVATYTGGSGTTALTFSYTVQAGQSAQSLAVTGVHLNGAVLAGLTSLVASLTGLSSLTQAGPEIWNGYWLAGGAFSGSDDTTYLGASVTETFSGTGNTVWATSTKDSLTFSGAAGAQKNEFLGNSATIAVGTNASVSVDGVNNAITLANNATMGVAGANNSISAGTDDSIYLNGGTGNSITASDDTIYLAGNVGATITGANDTIGASATGDSLTFGGNGQKGGDNTFLGSGASVIVDANSRADIDGANNFVTVGNGSTFGVNGSNNSISAGSDDSIYLNGGTGNSVTASDDVLTVASNVSATILGSGDTIKAAAGDVFTMSGATGATVDIGGLGGGVVSFDDYLPLNGDVIALLGGVGGYASSSAVAAALVSDGEGGADLSLGTAGTLHFIGMTPSQLSARNFAIG